MEGSRDLIDNQVHASGPVDRADDGFVARFDDFGRDHAAADAGDDL